MRFFFSMFAILLILTSCVSAPQPYTRYGSSLDVYGNDSSSPVESRYVPPSNHVKNDFIPRAEDKKVHEKTEKTVIPTIPSLPQGTFVSCNKVKSKYKILIDPGHGGKDRGGAANGVIEKDLVLTVSLKLIKLLKEKGFTVYSTRTTDVYPTLPQRVAKSKSVNASLMVSIHANAIPSRPDISGTEVIYPRSSTSSGNTWLSKVLANSIYGRFESNKKIGTFRNKQDVRNLYILRNAKVPTVIAEIGCMTNTADAKRLMQADYQTQIVNELYNGIVTYLNSR